MTESAETRPSEDAREWFGPSERLERERAQEAEVPSGRTVVSCSAPFGDGGLGRHFKEVADALGRRGQPVTCISGAARERAPRARLPARDGSLVAKVLSRLPLALARGWGTRAFFEEFDTYAARRLPDGEHLIAFNGQGLAQLRAARAIGYQSLALVSANSHLRHVVRQHERARRQYPLERSWAERLVGRNIQEYALAERIYVASRYTRESFLAEGVPEEKLSLFPFTPAPRFGPAGATTSSDTFDVVYIGSLSVAKGVPLLVDAVRRLAHADIRLRLVGGWSTPGMRRFVEQACAEDPRIHVSPGDPLPHLHAARLCVHPTFEDGFAYAPVEALACGVPVIVSEDTGMKELVVPGRNGLVLATGDLAQLTSAIDAAYRGELLDPLAARAADA